MVALQVRRKLRFERGTLAGLPTEQHTPKRDAQAGRVLLFFRVVAMNLIRAIRCKVAGSARFSKWDIGVSLHRVQAVDKRSKVLTIDGAEMSGPHLVS